MEITIKPKHFKKSTTFSDSENCPLSIACKETFKTNKVLTSANLIWINNTRYKHKLSDISSKINDLIKNAKQKKKTGEIKINLEKF